MTTTNRQIVLKSRPEGWPAPDNFEMREAPLPDIADGDVLVRALYMSLDPYMRSRIGTDRPPAERMPLDSPMEARVVGRVAAGLNIVAFAEPVQHHLGREQHGCGIGLVLTGNIRCRPVGRLEQAVVGA